MLNFSPSIIFGMGTPNWKPLKEEREMMEVVWMQVKGIYEKLKEETSAQDAFMLKMLQGIVSRYY